MSDFEIADHAEQATLETDGVTDGFISGDPIVDRDEGGETPRPDVAALSPGDYLELFGEQIRLVTVGKRVERGDKTLYRLGFAVEPIGTTSTLYVDRDPYLLSVCNGPVFIIPPEEVSVV